MHLHQCVGSLRRTTQDTEGLHWQLHLILTMQNQGDFDQFMFQQVSNALIIDDATQLLCIDSSTHNDLHLRKRQKLPADRVAV